jgi:CopG family transcriptional regulator / antitoxin EndoAI
LNHAEHEHLTVSLPPKLLRDAERVARKENRPTSELVREAIRFCIQERYRQKVQRVIAARVPGITSEEIVDRLIHAARK